MSYLHSHRLSRSLHTEQATQCTSSQCHLLEADICRRVGMDFPQIQAFPITCIVMKRCYNSFEFSKLLTLQILQYWKGKTWNIWYPTPRMVYETRLWWTSDFTKFKKVLIWYLRIVLRSDVIPSGALLLRISPEWVGHNVRLVLRLTTTNTLECRLPVLRIPLIHSNW